MEMDAGDYALRNDEAHDFTMVLYSIGAPAQQRQLAEAGFTLEVCMTDDGDAVTVGSETSGRPTCTTGRAARRRPDGRPNLYQALTRPLIPASRAPAMLSLRIA